jgi:hypothetical protein
MAGTMTVSIKPNEENKLYEPRTAAVTFTSGDASKIVSFTQAMKSLLSIVSGVSGDAGAYSINLPVTGGKKEIVVSANVDYSVTSDADWLSVAATKAVKSSTITIDANDNTGGNARSATLKISYGTSSQIAILVFEDGKTGQAFRHQTMLFRFTATWCGYCPYMERAITTAKSQHPDLFNEITFYSPTGMLDSNIPGSPYTVLSDKYGISGIPYVVLDSRCKFGLVSYDEQENANLIIKACQEDSTSYPALVGISISTAVSVSKISVSVGVKTSIQLGQMKLCVAITEDGVQTSEHVDILRNFMTDVNGEDIQSTPNDIVTKTYQFDAPSGVNLSNCNVVAYVFTPYGSYNPSLHGISDATYFSGSLTSAFIANSVSCKAGESIDFKYAE